MTLDTEHISGRVGGAIRNQTRPLSLEKCRGVTVYYPIISGGHNCIEFQECINCHVIMGSCSDPLPVPDKRFVGKGGFDPEDPASHNILFNGCRKCSVVGTACENTVMSGDILNFFNCTGCTAKDVKLSGPVGLKGTAAIIDGPDGHSNKFWRLQIEALANVNVCGGWGHELKDFHVPGPAVGWTAEYYAKAALQGGRLEKVTGNRLYLGKGLITEPELIRCRFNVIERWEAEQKAGGKAKRPAGWSLKKWLGWLSKRGR